MGEKEKEFRERLEKEQIEKEQREKEQKKQKEKKQKEKEYQNWKNAQYMSGNLAKPTQYEPGKPISTKSFIVILGGIFLFIISAIFFLTPKNLSLSVPEALKKIEISKAMDICAGTRGADSRKVGLSDDLDLSIALERLSEKEGLELYVDNSFKKHFYNVVGWNDGSKNGPEQTVELVKGCTYLINNDEEFAKEFNRVWGERLGQGNKMAAAEREKEEADRVKFAPQLEKWNEKFSNLGGGGVVNYLTALAQAENFIQQGAAYSLTGVARGAVQSVSCDPTNRSRWSSGVPTGWWSCLIDFEGSDYDVFSIEFTENSWRGVPDRGRQAGTDLKNIEIPQDLIEWLGKQE